MSINLIFTSYLVELQKSLWLLHPSPHLFKSSVRLRRSVREETVNVRDINRNPTQRAKKDNLRLWIPLREP